MYYGILDFILVFSGEGSKCLGNFKCIVFFFSHHIVVHAGRNIGRYVFFVQCTPDFEKLMVDVTDSAETCICE